MENVSCHRNQSSYPTGIKNITFVEGNVICKFENLQFTSPRQPIKLSDLDKSRMKHGGLLNKNICENCN